MARRISLKVSHTKKRRVSRWLSRVFSASNWHGTVSYYEAIQSWRTDNQRRLHMNYWLFKSEPDEFSIDHLIAQKKQTARWDGIRNYQARNHLRDDVTKGDQVLFYHSSCKDTGIAGVMQVVKAAYPDPAQFDPDSKYHDPKSDPDNPRWYCVDVQCVEKLPALIATKTLKADPQTAQMGIFKHSRLSVSPVTAQQWKAVQRLRKG